MQTRVINIEVSKEHEGTSNPYWLVLDPCQMMSPDPHILAEMIKGPFFSREEATIYLKRNKHNHSHRAVVYCHHSPYYTQYSNKLDIH